jgi:putative ABC transport system permease protein
MMNKMIVSNLAHRPVRSAISIVAIAIEVTLILLIVGFSLGMLNDSRSRQAGIGADVIVLPPSSANFVGVTGAPMPVKIGDLIAKLPHVTVVSPVLIQISTTGGHLQNLFGIDVHSFEALHPFTYLKGGPFQDENDVLVDDIYANGNHAKVGDRVHILPNQTFRIAGIVAHGQGARVFLQLAKLQDLNGAPDRASAFYIKADNPANTEAVVEEIKKIPNMDSYGIHSMEEYLSMLTPDNVPMLSTFIRIVIGIAVTIGIIVIFQAMYAAVMERTREIGILKSLGASKVYIVSAILRETTVLAVGGIIVGIAISMLASAVIQNRTTLPVDIQSGWIVRAIIIAIVGSLAGAIYPALKAAQKDPIDALAYE